MTDKQPPRTAILPSDIDAQGNVTLWDHGPQEPKKIPADTEEQAKARADRHAAEAKAWHDEHGDAASPLTMSSGDAGHAMTVEPGRYALEPDDIDEGEVEKRVKAMKDKRDAARDFAQSVIDRKIAIAEIMSERSAATTAAKTEAEAKTEVLPADEPWTPGKTLRSPDDRPLQVGDIVQHDDGPDMTVERIRDDGQVECTWMVGGGVNRNAFAPSALKKKEA